MDKAFKWAEVFLCSIAAIFTPIKSLLTTVAIMVAADLSTGILASKKQGEPITSAGLRRTITKLFVYEAAIMFAYITEHYVSDVLPFVKLASAMVALVELKSVYENLNIISGTNLMKGLISKLDSENNNPPPTPPASS